MSWQRSLGGFGIASALIVVAACVAPAGGARPSSPADQKSASPESSKTGDVVYLRDFQQYGAIVALDADTGQEVARFGAGIATPDWKSLYGAELSGGATIVSATDVSRGTRTSKTIDGAGGYTFALPAVSFTGEPGGFSPNAKWLVLTTRGGVDYSSSGKPTKTPFVVLDAALREPSKYIELSGNYTFDAISDSGRYLYLEEHLAADSYRVRVYDLQLGQLLPQIVFDKSATGDRMAGTRVGSIASPDGQWQFTLYWRQGGNSFVHAIKLEEQWSVCLFLPVQTSGEEDFAWSFVASPDGRTAYAVNNLKGYVASIALTTATVTRTATIDLQHASAPSLGDELARFFFPVAEAKSEMFSVGVVSPDGRTLYASGDFGRKIFAIDTATFALKAKYAIETSTRVALQVMSIGVSADGARLYAIDSEGKSLVRLDAATGRLLQQVRINGAYAGRILRVVSH